MPLMQESIKQPGMSARNMQKQVVNRVVKLYKLLSCRETWLIIYWWVTHRGSLQYVARSRVSRCLSENVNGMSWMES